MTDALRCSHGNSIIANPTLTRAIPLGPRLTASILRIDYGTQDFASRAQRIRDRVQFSPLRVRTSGGGTHAV